MSNHTPEPWRVESSTIDGGDDDFTVRNETRRVTTLNGYPGSNARDNAERIALCVNWCAGVEASEMHGGIARDLVDESYKNHELVQTLGAYGLPGDDLQRVIGRMIERITKSERLLKEVAQACDDSGIDGIWTPSEIIDALDHVYKYIRGKGMFNDS
jgi:hypothetical protein